MARLTLLALLGVLAVSSAFATESMPEAVPNRGEAVKAGRTLAQAVAPVYLDSADVDFAAAVPGDSLAGYGYYSPPGMDAFPTDLGPNNQFLAVFPGKGNALIADSDMTTEFTEGVTGQLITSFPRAKAIYVLQPKLSATTRRLLQTTPVETKFAIEYDDAATDAQLAAGREYMLGNVVAVFPVAFTDKYELETPTVTSINGNGSPTSSPGSGQGTGAPTSAPGGAATRTPLSLVMTLLALFGSAMLISLL